MKYTFGKTRACHKLELLLEDNQSARRKVSRLLSSFTNKLFHVAGARDPNTVLTCMQLLRAHTLNRVDVLRGVPEDVRSYTKNVITYRYRVYRAAFESIIPALKEMIEKDRLTNGEKGV